MDMIAVGDCSVDLGVLGVVNELSVHDGTGAGSAQRVDVEVGVCRSDGTGAGVVHRVVAVLEGGVVCGVESALGVGVVVWLVLAVLVMLVDAAAVVVVGVVVDVVVRGVFVGVVILV